MVRSKPEMFDTGSPVSQIEIIHSARKRFTEGSAERAEIKPHCRSLCDLCALCGKYLLDVNLPAMFRILVL